LTELDENCTLVKVRLSPAGKSILNSKPPFQEAVMGMVNDLDLD
jgi:hypothetical protein